MTHPPLRGLIAATSTPLSSDGSVKLDAIGPTVDRLLDSGVSGFYVCGSTGEGMSLTSVERQEIVRETVQAVNQRASVIVQVGHNSLAEAHQLAKHAESVGVDILSATCPSYFKVHDAETLCQCMQQITRGTECPFYYYHIPALTGSPIDIVKWLELAVDEIPTLAGLKYTAPLLHEFQSCLHANDGELDIVWGCDEMLLGAMATGAQAAIGSTYNLAAPLYQKIIDAFQRGDLENARRLQYHSVQMVEVMKCYPFHGALKQMMQMLGLHGGPCRFPLRDLDDEQATALRAALDEIGFFQWCGMVEG
ncbi:MAG: dihydrodipicolinate synthase family protein [Planctomycetota bacterium]